MAASLQRRRQQQQPPLSEPQNDEAVQSQSQSQSQTETGTETQTQTKADKVYSTYIGVSFAVFLSLLPKNALSLLPTLQSRSHYLLHRLRKAEEELFELRSRRQEDSKANARVVEIFATHRNAWQQEERRLLRRLDESAEEISRLRSRLAELEAHESQLLAESDDLRREVGERDELLNFMTRHKGHEMGGGGESVESESGGFASLSGEEREWGSEEEDANGAVNLMFGHLGNDYNDGFDPNYLSSGSKFWGETRPPPNLWQEVQYDSIEPTHHVKHFVVRRESPWKVDGETTGVPSKLKVLEEELLNMEKVGKSNSPKVVSSMRKQAKRYQDLAGKIDDLCRRMQASDPIEPTMSSEFRSQIQTEFLLEAFQLQQRASETGKKLMTFQTEMYTSCVGDELGVETKIAMRSSLDSIRTNFKEIQRNLEVWLARIMGDLEGILARDGASRARDYYCSRYPYVNSYS